MLVGFKEGCYLKFVGIYYFVSDLLCIIVIIDVSKMWNNNKKGIVLLKFVWEMFFYFVNKDNLFLCFLRVLWV